MNDRDHFDPETGALCLTLPLPPPDNQCHRSGAYGRYPTTAYQDWLRIAQPQLAELLGDWQPDTERWWFVSGLLALGSRGDGQNYLKAVLDLFSGAQVKPETPGKGSILKPGALWNDDRRVVEVQWLVQWVRHPEPDVFLRVFPRNPALYPRDWKAAQPRTRRKVGGQ